LSSQLSGAVLILNLVELDHAVLHESSEACLYDISKYRQPKLRLTFQFEGERKQISKRGKAATGRACQPKYW